MNLALAQRTTSYQPPLLSPTSAAADEVNCQPPAGSSGVGVSGPSIGTANGWHGGNRIPLTDWISPDIRERLLTIQSMSRAGARQSAIAARLGLTCGALSRWLARNGLGWPVHDPTLEALLARRVETSAEARLRRKREERAEHLYRPKDFDQSYPEDPMLSPEQIAARRDAARLARQTHETYWLGQEMRRYGLTRMGLPLSRMVL